MRANDELPPVLPVAEELFFTGPHEATFQFEIGNPDLRKETGEVRHANAQNHVADFETTTPGFTMVNAAIGYRIFGASVVHDLMLRGNNLTDELAYNHVNPIKDAVPMPGRDFTVSYQLTF